MRNNTKPIAGMIGALLFAFGLDQLDKRLHPPGEFIETLVLVWWGMWAIQVVFILMLLLIAWYFFMKIKLQRKTSMILTVTGGLITLTATPIFWAFWAGLPSSQFPRVLLFPGGPRLMPDQYLLEAAVFIMGIGIGGYFIDRRKNNHSA